MKDLPIKRVDSDLNADQSNFLANKIMRDVLEFHVKSNFIQNSSPLKPSYKCFY